MRLPLHESPLPGLEEERRADHRALDAGQSLDGAPKPAAAHDGVSAPEWGAQGPRGAEKAPEGTKTALKARRHDDRTHHVKPKPRRSVGGGG